MSAEKLHPDYLEAPEENRWARPLAELAEALRHGAYAAQGEWFWMMMPRGALVAMRVPPTFCKELRVARRLRRALTDKTATMWHTEVATFLEHLGCTGWKCTKDVIAGGGPPGEVQLLVEVIYQEPAPLGAKPSVEKCGGCGTEFEVTPGDRLYRTPTCNRCAMRAGAVENAGGVKA